MAEEAGLNANYIKARLSGVMTPAFPEGPCMHEALFDDSWLEGTGVTTLDFAKAMIDEGFHPMTMYFPLVVHGAMLIEPTETESKAELDRFCDAMIAIRKEIADVAMGLADMNDNVLKNAPHTAAEVTDDASFKVVDAIAHAIAQGGKPKISIQSVTLA